MCEHVFKCKDFPDKCDTCKHNTNESYYEKKW